MINTGSIVKAIGAGFVMDDYLLELAVPNAIQNEN